MHIVQCICTSDADVPLSLLSSRGWPCDIFSDPEQHPCLHLTCVGNCNQPTVLSLAFLTPHCLQERRACHATALVHPSGDGDDGMMG